jgi:hypothetical protein
VLLELQGAPRGEVTFDTPWYFAIPDPIPDLLNREPRDAVPYYRDHRMTAGGSTGIRQSRCLRTRVVAPDIQVIFRRRRAKASLPLELLAASIELREPAEVTGTNSLGRARLYLLSQRRLAVF